MIANPNWFSIRKYGGWGLTPNCWQGWAYIGVVALPFVLLNLIPLPEDIRTLAMFTWASIFSLDFIITFVRLKKDERESAHESVAERNALWAMVAILVLGIGYQIASGIVKDIYQVDPVILIALLGAAAVKSITHLYLRDK